MFTPPTWYTVAKDFAVPLTALGWGISTWIRDNRRKLSIHQVGSSVTSRIEELECLHTTAFAVDEILITNDSPKATITIASYAVRPPWADEDLHALADPAENMSESYEIHGSHIEIRRDLVLNHLRFQHGKLQPGDTIRGAFVAKGVNPIPDDLKHDGPIELDFIVTDTKGKIYKQKVRAFPRLVHKLVRQTQP